MCTELKVHQKICVQFGAPGDAKSRLAEVKRANGRVQTDFYVYGVEGSSENNAFSLERLEMQNRIVRKYR